MPNFVIDSIDIETTYGGVPSSGTVKARIFSTDTDIDISALLSSSSLLEIHRICIDELRLRWGSVCADANTGSVEAHQVAHQTIAIQSTFPLYTKSISG